MDNTLTQAYHLGKRSAKGFGKDSSQVQDIVNAHSGKGSNRNKDIQSN